MFVGVWDFLQATFRGRPAFVVLDDVHFADRSSLDLLAFLLERLSGIPLLLVLAYRPGSAEVDRIAMRASHTAIRLEPLDAEESVALARGYLGVHGLPADLERLVVERAEGNPFFIEELLRALIEVGSLIVEDGRAVLVGGPARVPDTIQGTILARVDRLGPEERAVLQQASVLGRAFDEELLAAIGGPGVGRALEELARAQLVVIEGPGRWAFKHGLIQEVVYGTLLLRQRRELHRAVAEVLERRAGEDPAFPETLAEHWARAQDADKARRYALAAGDMARERMGFLEATARYQTALRLWGDGDERGRLDLLMRLGETAYQGGDATTSRTALVEAVAGWEALGEVRAAGSALATLGRVYWVSGESARAAEVLTRAVGLLEPAGRTPELVRALMWASTLHMLLGDVDRAAPLAREGLAMAEELGLDGPRAHLLITLGTSRGMEGDPAGLHEVREGLDLARRVGEAEAVGRGYANASTLLWEMERYREGAEVSREGRDVMGRTGSPSFVRFLAGNEAQSLVELGAFEEAERITRGILELLREAVGTPGWANAAMTLVTVLVRTGRYGEARHLLDQALPVARGLGGSEFLAPFALLEAELEEARGNAATARQAALEGVETLRAAASTSHRFW